MLLVGNGILIALDDANTFLPDGALYIVGDTIMAVGSTSDLRRQYPLAEFIDAEGGLIMPGMQNVHTHTYSTFARGMSLKDAPPTNFTEILSRLWWRLDQALDLDGVYYSAVIHFLDCIKNGTTTVLDHHASPNAISGSLRAIARAAADVGVRSNLCYEVTDRDGIERAAAGLAENESYIVHCQTQADPMSTATFGLHASFTVGDDTLRQAADMSARLGVGVHLHVAEDMADVTHCLSHHQKNVVERLHSFDLLGSQTMAAHCVHIVDAEMELLAATGTNVAHNPESNMGNAVGCAPVREMLAAQVRVGMGTDAYTADMFEGVKVANLLHKFNRRDPSAAWGEVPQLIFKNNRQITANYFAKQLGELAPGAFADVIIIDYAPPTPLTASNFYGHLLFGVSGGLVNTTIVGGKVRMRDRQLQGVDEKALAGEARRFAALLWDKF
ncbi:MAG: putative aminohydrolase SsnA [Firmicutes bacterium]|nr:putative aminohydrolase SsnA [Dethiobacter sp.]MBS3888509.1 putative aminohydrolase SsnA [Bacillota bacterium]